MELRFFELRVSRGETQGVYRLFAMSDHLGEGEALSEIDPLAPPFRTLSSLLEQPCSLEDLRALGTALFESLFRDGILRVFQGALMEVLSSNDLGLRIVLRIEPPELAFLP